MQSPNVSFSRKTYQTFTKLPVITDNVNNFLVIFFSKFQPYALYYFKLNFLISIMEYLILKQKQSDLSRKFLMIISRRNVILRIRFKEFQFYKAHNLHQIRKHFWRNVSFKTYESFQYSKYFTRYVKENFKLHLYNDMPLNEYVNFKCIESSILHTLFLKLILIEQCILLRKKYCITILSIK